MASWSPAPTIGNASWQGNPPLVTKRQFLSTVAGLEVAIQNYSTISVSTLTVPDWISTRTLYVSSIVGANIDISGIIFDASGLLYAPTVSSGTGTFKFIEVSSVAINGPSVDSLVKVNVDFSLGEFAQGALSGVGNMLFQTLLGIGVGTGAVFVGLGNGIAALVNSKDPVNNPTYINTSNFEVVGGSTQLQVSTLGNAFPVYSSIMRYVSTSAPNQVPGAPIFTSTLFYPGQICIRSISDPIPLVSGNSNVFGSTIQQFGEWVPFEGLEPENIVANSVSTVSLEASYALIDTVILSSLGVAANASMNYNADILFTTGSGPTNYARILGSLQNLYIQTDNKIAFTQLYTSAENASLTLGPNADESLLIVSSIYSQGNIQANSGYISTLTVENLIVVSTINTTSTNVQNITSTATIFADEIYAQFAAISTMAPFNFNSSILGNPLGQFDITRYDSVVSTTYNQVSSLTQNILSYSLNATVQDQTTFNALTPAAPIYTVSPQNVQQWESTMLICNPGADIGGQLAMTFSTSWQQANLTGQFDLTVDMTQTSFSMSAVQYAAQSPGGGYINTFFYQPPTPGFFQTWRFTVDTTGVWSAVTPAPPPPMTSNNNTFQIYQDINDTYIKATDRLHLQAGDILLDGTLNLENFAVTNLNAQTANLTSTFAQGIQVSSIGSKQFQQIYSFTGSQTSAAELQPLNFQYTLNSTDFINLRTLTVPSRGPNMFNSLNVSEWNNAMYNNPSGTSATTGGPIIYLGELTKTFGYAYSGQFWINNTTSPSVSFPIYVIKPGSWLSTLGAAVATGTGYTRIATPDGLNWTIQSNVPNPQGSGGQATNSYSLTIDYGQTSLNVGQTFVETAPSKTTIANKIILGANQIRTYTYQSPSFQSREAGFELSSYFDPNVIFSGSQSDAVNAIVSPAGNLGYAVVAWSPQLWFGRMRTNYGIQGFEIEAVVLAFSGTFADFIWASHRYINITLTPSEANIREIYFMVPCNYMTYENLVGPY